MAFKIYSIESRKGGVGKTTIALNLAKQLLSKGPVLLLDCDITGTSISDPASNSIYWKNDANVLKDEKGTPMNLLGYFLDKYIKGNGNMNDFMKEGMLQEKKINVLGSQLYAPSSRAIADTRLLMDEIHSYWLVEFVNSLITSFSRQYNGKTVHIIIDNSPGYVGFCQALHHYMLKLGPAQAKFLMVASIDEQDLKSSAYACSEIQTLVQDRQTVANYYRAQLQGGSINADMEAKIADDEELKKFYFSFLDNPEQVARYVGANLEAKNYLALILNKVPKNLSDDNFDYTFENVIRKEDSALFNAVTSSKDSKPQTIVYYDEDISYQYYIKYLRSQIEDVSRDKYWSGRFKDLENLNAEYSFQSDRIGAIGKVETIYNNLLSNLATRGYNRVAKVIPASWNPSYSIGKLQDVLTRIPSRAYASRHLNENAENIEKTHQYNLRNLHSAKSRSHFIEDSQELDALFKYVDNTVRDDDTLGGKRYAIVSLFLHVALKLMIEGCEKKSGLREYLIGDLQELSHEYSWHEYVDENLIQNLHLSVGSMPVEMPFSRYFDRFYFTFCTTLLRLIDMHTDFDILIRVLRQYIPTTSPLMFSRELIEYLTNVMVNKSETYSEARLSAIKENSFVMKRVQEVVRDYVLKNWN